MRSSSSRSRGFSLLEIALALAVVSVTFAAAATLYLQSTSEGNVSDHVAFHSVLEASVKAAWPHNDYEGVSTETAAALFSANPRLVDGGELRGPRGMEVLVAPRSLPGSGANRHFEIRYQDMRPAVCSSLVLALAERLERAEVGAEVIHQRSAPTDPQRITEACSGDEVSLALVPVN